MSQIANEFAIFDYSLIVLKISLFYENILCQVLWNLSQLHCSLSDTYKTLQLIINLSPTGEVNFIL